MAAGKHELSSRSLLRAPGAAQDGQFSTRRSAALGVTHAEVLAMRDAREIANVRYALWRFVSAVGQADPAITAFLACWPFGVISHDSAAVYHGLRRIRRPARPHITVLHGQTCRPAGIAMHHTVALPGGDVVIVGTLRYSSLARVVCDLANPRDPWETLAVVDDSVSLGASRTWLNRTAMQLALGRGGVDLVAKATHRVLRPSSDRGSNEQVRTSSPSEAYHRPSGTWPSTTAAAALASSTPCGAITPHNPATA